MTGRTALVIDDEPQIRRVVRHVLTEDFTRILEPRYIFTEPGMGYRFATTD